ncbi:hypothetical protein C8Q77DRAFT_1214598 [Trametes polyzona]|nr:hypothetical protein C8Q77DRAFT_1214598 [Trametes polyzona]
MSLSSADFPDLEPAGRHVLRLLDPSTNQLCDYRLVKVPRCTPNSIVGRDDSAGTDSSLFSGSRQEANAPSASDLWSGPPSFRARVSPLARLPPLSVRSRGDGTPSLFEDTHTTDASSPSFGSTPVRQLFRNSLNTPADLSWGPTSSACVGLGFSDLYKHDGTPFDGLGSLPRHTSTPYNRSGDSSPISPATTDSPRVLLHPLAYPRNFPGSRASSTPSAARVAEQCPPPQAPTARRITSERLQSASGPLPVKPEQDDIFFSRPVRVPGSLTRGLFRRGSSAGGTRRRGSVASPSEMASVRKTSLGWAVEEKGSEREKDGNGADQRPVWRP